MRAKKGKKRSETPELRFQRKLMEEYRKNPGMMIKMERMAQGRMADYRVRYVHAHQLDPHQLEICLRELWGDGSCLLRFVDETRQPLDEFGGMWIDLGDYDDLDDRLEEAQFAASMAVLKMSTEMNKKSMDAGMDCLTVLAGLAGNIRRNRIDPRIIDACRRSMQSARPDNSKVIHETMRMMSEMRDKEQQRITKQQADAAKQLQTALSTIVAEVQALQAQELECQTQAESISQERQFPPGNCSQPIVGLSLQRLNTRGILQGLGKPQDRREDDQ